MRVKLLLAIVLSVIVSALLTIIIVSHSLPDPCMESKPEAPDRSVGSYPIRPREERIKR